MKNRIYGCDDCLAVCPWNKFAKKTNEEKFMPRNDLIEPNLSELINLDDETFRQKFRFSSIKRIGRDRFIRNVLIAIGNSKDKNYYKQILGLLEDKSELVRAMAVWAMRKICDASKFIELKCYFKFGLYTNGNETAIDRKLVENMTVWYDNMAIAKSKSKLLEIINSNE